MSLSHEVRVLNAESDLAWARSRPEELEKSIVADRQLKEEMSAAAAKVCSFTMKSDRCWFSRRS
ncbi:hypothetical protein PC118_g12966 [Phytophthora cactorum]|uniref:Uncharacterized protein n=1 Tax=Phytophthora cactorum TaxID=29920 RepID=A0A8T1CKF8_9STRA|nr:hypothetical protein PC117_g15371 [Phytophthora cactorum]KAG2977286.1 hypothetical protein PC118_g12966 [Phytophthora cactorum]KAG3011055.1 hypothetical protein PC120_g14673 [Phytophthora cactorum]KAG3055202.1 hypothetical protein PC121_g15910 [Phytophthora cactorum]KAG3157070.1 hypothetical protein C6341_g14869 [Phytophthora cactorum]